MTSTGCIECNIFRRKESSQGAQVGVPGGGLWSTTGSPPPGSERTVVNVGPVTGTPESRPTSSNVASTQKGRSDSPEWSACESCAKLPFVWCCYPCTCYKIYCWIVAAILVFVVVVGLMVVIIWKCYHPKFPNFNVDNANFQYSVTGAPGAYLLSSDTKFDLILGNPNTKIGILYDQIKLKVQMFSLVLGNQVIPAFYNGYQDTKIIHGDMVAGPLPLSSADQAALLVAQAANKVPLSLSIDVKVRVKAGGLVVIPQLKLGLRCLVSIDPAIMSGSQISDMSCKFKFF